MPQMKFVLQLMLLEPSAVMHQALARARRSDHVAGANGGASATQQVSTLRTRYDTTTRALAWSGEIVAADANDVWRMTTDYILAFAADRATLIIIDLAQLRFIDSSGAALMLRLKQATQHLDAALLFTHAHPNVRKVLRLTGLESVLLEGGQ